MSAMVLGQKIKQLRKKHGYTLQILADLTKSSKSYIWELESKPMERPSADKLSKIARRLGVTIDYLLDDSASITVSEAEDKEFFRKYMQLDDESKANVRALCQLCFVTLRRN